jgi:hypothetical protein
MSDDLVERVMAAMYNDPTDVRTATKRGIAIALHEAAKVAVLTINSRPELTSYDVWLAICDLIPTWTIPAQDDTGNSE